MASEIERKFLLPTLPIERKISRPVQIKQGYLKVEKTLEIRVRQYGRRFFQTIKDGKHLERQEVEIRLNKRQFEQLWEHTSKARVFKSRMKTIIDHHVVEIDRFENELLGLITAEVEFKSLDEAYRFSPPSWFGPEVTYDSRLKNKNLALFPLEPTTLPSNPNNQSKGFVVATIPYFFQDNKTYVVLVTSRNRGKIICPKGQPESKFPAHEVALAEALEEGGIEGNITHHPFVIEEYKSPRTSRVVYPIEVCKLHEDWLEKTQRKRLVVTLEEALKNSECEVVHKKLRIFNKMLEQTKTLLEKAG